MADLFATATVTIPTSSTESEAFDMAGMMHIVRIDMPADWTAAPLSFLVAQGDHVYRAASHGYDDGVEEVAIAVAPGCSISCSPPVWGARFVRLRSGTAEAPVPQAAARTITVVMSLPPPEPSVNVTVNTPPNE